MDSKSPQAQCFFSLKTQFENVGDALINREMVRLASSYGQAHVDLSRCPASFVQTLGFDGAATIYKGFVPLCMSMITRRLKKHPCYYFLSPGGYVGELSYKDVLTRIINTLVLLLFSLIGIRICLVGVSYERLGPRNIFMQKIRSRLLYRHFLRDKTSIEYAKNNGIKVNGIMPDLAFNIFTYELKEQQVKAIPEHVAFSFRTDQYEAQKEQVFQTVEALLEMLDQSTNYTLVSQVGRDREGMFELKALIEDKTGSPISFVDGADSIDKCTKAYSACDLVISNRLHSLLIGVSVIGHLVAVTGEGKNKKIEGVLAEIDSEDLRIPAGEMSKDELETIVKAALAKTVDGRKLHNTLQKVFKDMLAG